MKKKPGIMARINLKMTGAMGRVMLSCNEATRLISQSSDEKLPFRGWLALKAHLMFCRWCRMYEKQVNLMRSLIIKVLKSAPLRKVGTSITLSTKAREKIKNSLKSNESDS